MPRDIIITPASGLVDFKDDAGNIDAKIQIDTIGNLSITNSGGSLTLGDSAANVFIGDGTNSSDIIFEQNGAIRALTGKTLTLGQSDSNITIASPTTFNLGVTIAGNLAVNGTVGTLVSTGNIISDNSNILLNDISNLADGSVSVFTLRNNQTDLGLSTVVDNKDLQVVVNGRTLKPYVNEITYPWIVDSLSVKDYRVRENRLIIYNAPDNGSDINITLRKTALTKQTRRYPFSATTISLGD
jgi:hypothetical protein